MRILQWKRGSVARLTDVPCFIFLKEASTPGTGSLHATFLVVCCLVLVIQAVVPYPVPDNAFAEDKMPRRPRSPSSGSGDANDKSKQLPHQRPEDDKLIALYNQGNMSAYIAQVYVYCRPGVISFLREFVAPKYQQHVEDIAQDSFINFMKMIWRRHGRQFPLPQPFNHFDYIREVARNEYLKRLDKEKKVPTVSLS